MSILIKGMKMPQRGMVVNIYADGRVTNHFDEFGKTIGKAVSVPPHGRLIDADAMIRDIEKSLAPSWYIKERNADMVKFLSLEDTVIPAEEYET